MAPDEVTLVSWLKGTGDPVALGEVVAVVETAKADLEIESAGSGILGRQLFPELAQIVPGVTIAYVLEPGESEPSPQPAPESVSVSDSDSDSDSDKAPALGADTEGNEDTARPGHTQSPRQRRMAAEAAQAPSAPSDIDVGERSDEDPAERYRRAISAAVSRSWQEIPHFAVTRELRVDELVGAVDRWRAALPGLTLTDLLLRVLALGFLERERRSELDVGLAVATGRGVAIPVLRNVLRLGPVELIDARRAAVERARAGRLHADDARVPVATLSNLGAVGVDQFTGIVPFGQTSLLTVGRAAQRPVVDDGQLAVATTMHVTLNVDHRSWDGLHAGQLLDRFSRIVGFPDLFFGDLVALTSLVKDPQ